MKKQFPYLKNQITISLADIQLWFAENEIKEEYFDRAIQIYMAEKMKPVAAHLRTYKKEILDYPSPKASWEEVIELSASLVSKVSSAPSRRIEEADKIYYIFSDINEDALEKEFVALLEQEDFIKLAKSCDIQYRFLSKGKVALAISLFPD